MDRSDEGSKWDVVMRLLDLFAVTCRKSHHDIEKPTTKEHKIKTGAMAKVKRNCDQCGKEYKADMRNLKRGWGLCCSKSCAAKKRERSKPGYDPEVVAENNIRRKDWNKGVWDVATRTRVDGYTSEGYRVIDGVAYNEFDEPMYAVTGEDDPGDSMYWESKDY